MDKFDVAVIGGGAAGLACAVTLAGKNKNINVCVLDAGERPGKKLAATGNGQGNISNSEMTAEHFHGGNLSLVEHLACKDPFAGAKLFDCLFSADEKGRIYPAGRQASALTDSLLNRLKHSDNVKIMTETRVTDIERTDEGFLIEAGNVTVFADFVLLSVGGKAQKQFKTDGSSYFLAEKFGHKLTRLYPSLVQLKTDTAHIKTLKGIRADCAVTAFVGGKAVKKVRGDVIFTDYGVSGNAVFSVSSYVADKQSVTLSLEFLPDFSAEEIEKSISARKNSGCDKSELLSGSLHNQIGRAIIRRAASDEPEKIVKILKNFTLSVTGTLGFDYAQVTKGGIDFEGVTDELESKYAKNLFFAGEVLDVDGDCGGYNLQWAFTSGAFVAENIIKRYD